MSPRGNQLGNLVIDLKEELSDLWCLPVQKSELASVNLNNISYIYIHSAASAA
jgi:hypothetical protein